MNPRDTEHRPDESTSNELTCPVCGDDHVSTFVHRDAFEYGTGESAVTLHVDLPVRRCTACDLEFLDHEGERIRHEAVCRHLGVLTSTEIRAIRKKYGMTRSSFARNRTWRGNAQPLGKRCRDSEFRQRSLSSASCHSRCIREVNRLALTSTHTSARSGLRQTLAISRLESFGGSSSPSSTLPTPKGKLISVYVATFYSFKGGVPGEPWLSSMWPWISLVTAGKCLPLILTLRHRDLIHSIWLSLAERLRE